MLSAKENPGAVFPDGASVSAIRGTWWVAHTKARQEKALAHDLARKGVSYFLPLVERLRVIRGRRFRPLIPLFPSYVFVCGSENDRVEALRGNRLAGTIAVGDQARLVRELTHVQKALSSDAAVHACPLPDKGRLCRVTAGPFEGIEGIVTQQKGPTRLILAVRSLGQAVYLEIEADLLEQV